MRRQPSDRRISLTPAAAKTFARCCSIPSRRRCSARSRRRPLSDAPGSPLRSARRAARPHRQRHRRHGTDVHVCDRPRHLVARTRQLATKLPDRLASTLEAHHLGPSQRGRHLDGRVRDDVGRDGCVLPAFPSAFRSAVNRISPITVIRTPQSSPRDGREPLSWPALIDDALRHAPGQHVARVVVPASERAAFLVQFSPISPTPLGADDLFSVYLDQYSGAMLTPATTPRVRWRRRHGLGRPAARGELRRERNPCAWLLLGIAPPLLFITGFIMWWIRVVRTRWVRVTQPAAETARP